VVLCALEGHSQEEAARQLGWTPGSVKGRLERGRKRLHARLARRGLTLTAVLGAAEVVRASGTAVPAALAVATAQAAAPFVSNNPVPAGMAPAHITALAQGVLTAMLRTRMQAAALASLVVIAAGLVAGLACRAAAPAQAGKGEPPGPTPVVQAPALRAGAKPPAPQQKQLQGGGSSLALPLMSQWAAQYARSAGVQVNYQAVGSGAGTRQVGTGVVDFGCTDVPLTDAQIAKLRQDQVGIIHVPLALWAVVPVYNLPNVPRLRLSGPVLADIYLGSVRRWNDPALQRLNPGVRLPDMEIAVVRRADGSSATFLWTDYLSKISPAWRQQVGAGPSVRWPVGLGAQGDAGVTVEVQRSPGSIGYVTLGYARQKKLPYGLVKNRAGAFVLADGKSVAAAAAASVKGLPEDLRYSLTDAPGKGSYPISGTAFAIVSDRMPEARRRALLHFLRWVTHEGQRHAEEAQQGRLPPGLVERLDKQLERLKGGN
jgi:phosphate transport system substrate-binding protein